MAVIPFVAGRTAQARRFDALVRPHVPALYQFAYRLLRNQPDAEDLVQDVLTKLYPRTGELADVKELRPWLLRVTYNQFVDALRRAQRTVATVADSEAVEPVDPGPDPEQQHAADQGMARVNRALARLNADQRLLVTLHLVDGYTLEEIATTLDVPLGTLKSRLHRAKAQLKILLDLEPFSASERVDGHELR